MTTKIPTLRLYPVEFGYGPLGKALHIARAIRRLVDSEDLRLELVIGKRLGDPVEYGLFDQVMSDLDASSHADLTLTIMNTAGVQRCAMRGERIFVVDSLAWLWDAPLPIGELADRYYYQDIPILPVPPRNLAGIRDPRPIPAIVELIADEAPVTASGTRQEQLLMSLSGLTNPYTTKNPHLIRAYLDLVLGWTGARDPRDGSAPEVAIYGNPSVLREHLDAGSLDKIHSGKQLDFLHHAKRNGGVVAAPGLTTILECLANHIPIALLPPQNYSQAKLIATFEKVGIPSLGWESPLLAWAVNANLPEGLGVELVNGIVSTRRSGNQGLTRPQILGLWQSVRIPEESTHLLGDVDGATILAADLVKELC